MGTQIDIVSTAFPLDMKPGVKHYSAHLAAEAAIESLKKSNLFPEEINILVNTGIYRTDNIGEPAMAAIIQDLISEHKFSKKRFKKQSGGQTFSFDLMNGGCGFLNAIQLIDGMIFSGSARNGLIVTSDVDPIPGHSEGFNYAPIAAAMILSSSKPDLGFVHFKSETFIKYRDYFSGQLVFSELKQKSCLMIESSEKYRNACLECIDATLTGFLDEVHLTKEEIDLIIPSQTPFELPTALNTVPGISGKVVEATNEFGELHTVGPAFALEQVWNTPRYQAAKNIVYITVSAGLTTSIALYKK